MLKEIRIDDILKHSDDPVYFLIDDVLYTSEEIREKVRVLVDELEDDEEEPEEEEPKKRTGGRASNKDEILRIYNSGVTHIKAIAEMVGCSEQTVRKYIPVNPED